jgi:hypothetical protein
MTRPRDQLDLIQLAKAWRAISSDPLRIPTPEREWLLTVVFTDRHDKLELYFPDENAAESALRLLCEVFTGKVDQERSMAKLRLLGRDGDDYDARVRRCCVVDAIEDPHHPMLDVFRE